MMKHRKCYFCMSRISIFTSETKKSQLRRANIEAAQKFYKPGIFTVRNSGPAMVGGESRTPNKCTDLPWPDSDWSSFLRYGMRV